MYKLYDMDIRTLIDKSPNELDILHTISEELQHLIPYKQRINLMVMSYENDMPVQVFINSFEDFINYVEDFMKRNTIQDRKMLKR